MRKSFLVVFLLTLIGGGVFYFAYQAQGVNRTWDGGGVDGTCGGAGTANNWSCPANWSGDTAPTASDVAIFDSTSTKDATINSAVSVAGISINAGYTGTITQSTTNTITVGSSNYSQADGTFTGGSGTITVNGTFTLSGGTFTGTSGTFTLNSGASSTPFTLSGGTFNHNNGTISFNGNGGCGSVTGTVDVVTTLTLYDIVINTGAGCGGTGTVTTGSGDTIIASNNFTQTGGYIGGTWQVQGNVIIGSGANGGGTLTMTGTGSKTYTYTASGTGPSLVINNAALSVSANGGTTALKIMTFSLLNGTFTAPTGTLEVGYSAQGSATLFTVSGGTFNHNNGTVYFNVNNANTNNALGFTADVATTLTLYNIIVNATRIWNGNSFTTGAGDTIIASNNFTHTDGELYGTWEVQGNYTVATTADGGSAGITFTGGNNQTYTDQGGSEVDGDVTINKSGGTVTLASNADWNAGSQDVNITSGELNMGASYNLSTTALTVSTAGHLSNNGTGDLTLAGNVTNTGNIRFRGNGTCGGTDDILIRSSSTGVQRTWSGSGVYLFHDVDVRDMAGSATITLYSSTNTANNGANWTFSGAGCPAEPPSAGLSTGKMNLR